MIRRNVAGQPILIGPLLAKADGADQTSGASILVRKDGVDVGTPGGSLSPIDSGVWQYIPTQGETDCAILGLVLTKEGCAAVPLNVVTTRIPVQTAFGIADEVLSRGAQHVEATADDLSLCSQLLASLNKSNTADNPGFLTIYRSNKSTEHLQIEIQTGAAVPLVGVG